MGFFRQLPTGGDTAPTPPVVVRERAESILYDPSLLDALLRDHAELGRIYDRIGEAGKAGHAAEARSLLASFEARLKAHVVVENARFYDYLEQTLPVGSRAERMVRRYRREMTKIIREVFAFVRKYQSSTFAPDVHLQFIADYETAGRALGHRLDSEEDNLYRLYRPA